MTEPIIGDIAARHVRCVCCVTRPPDCGSCGHLWPCDTARVLEVLRAERERAERYRKGLETARDNLGDFHESDRPGACAFSDPPQTDMNEIDCHACYSQWAIARILAEQEAQP